MKKQDGIAHLRAKHMTNVMNGYVPIVVTSAIANPKFIQLCLGIHVHCIDNYICVYYSPITNSVALFSSMMEMLNYSCVCLLLSAR